jgi:3'-5' exoribonuclease
MTTIEDFTQTLSDYFDRNQINDILSMCQPVFTDQRFWDWPASVQGKDGKTKHHGGRGGLARHTNEVLRYSLAAASAFADDDEDKTDRLVIAVAAIWHDMGKLDEYTVRLLGRQDWVESSRTEEAFLLSHIVRGISQWATFAAGLGIRDDQKFVDRVTHVIAAHHGRKEWGSPVVPQTIEALLVHQADMLSVMTDGGGNPNLRP